VFRIFRLFVVFLKYFSVSVVSSQSGFRWSGTNRNWNRGTSVDTNGINTKFNCKPLSGFGDEMWRRSEIFVRDGGGGAYSSIPTSYTRRLETQTLTSCHLSTTYLCSAYYRSAGKSLARPGKKQANVSVRMAWVSFSALPRRGKNLDIQLASRCCWNRARPWHASELVSFLVGLRTYQHPVCRMFSINEKLLYLSETEKNGRRFFGGGIPLYAEF